MSMTTTSGQEQHVQTIHSTRPVHLLKPSFFGMVGGELLKLSRLFITWIMVVCLIGGTGLLQLLLFTSSGMKGDLATAPLSLFYLQLDAHLIVMRVFGGIFLLILTSYAIGQDYQYGTIRILLSLGVGRVQLLLAKIAAMLCIALLLFVCWSLLSMILIGITMFSLSGNLNALSTLHGAFWANAGLYSLTVLISMAASIIAATMFTALSRSLALGLAGSIALFPVDNMGTLILLLLSQFTRNEFWMNITAYLLGPNLNAMPALLMPNAGFTVIGIGPVVGVTGVHTVWVALTYTVICAAVAIFVTWKRDVKE